VAEKVCLVIEDTVYVQQYLTFYYMKMLLLPGKTKSFSYGGHLEHGFQILLNFKILFLNSMSRVQYFETGQNDVELIYMKRNSVAQRGMFLVNYCHSIVIT